MAFYLWHGSAVPHAHSMAPPSSPFVRQPLPAQTQKAEPSLPVWHGGALFILHIFWRIEII